MTDWFSISDLFEFEKGTLQSSKCTPGKYTFITAAEEWKTHNEFTHDCEALIFAMAASGSLGRTHYFKGKFISSDLCFIMTPKEGKQIDLLFYYRIFNFLREDIVKKTATGTSKLAINQTNFGNYKVPFFDYDHQLFFRNKINGISNIKIQLTEGFTSQSTFLSLLRQSILQEAIEGKLTAGWRINNPVRKGDPEYDARALLEKIKEEKERLTADGKLKKQKLIEPIKPEEVPFELPEGWVWTRLGDCVSILGDGLHGTPNYSKNGKYFFINGNNLNEGKIVIKDNTKRVSKEEYNKHRKELNENTVFVSINGTLGNVAFYNNEKIILGKSACYFNLIDGINKYYIKQIIKTKYFLTYASDKASETTIKNLSLKGMRFLPIPLAPFDEQYTIIEQVDRLLSMVNELEQEIAERKEIAEKLLQSVLREAFGRR